ncbi:hypothetical protein CBS115989_3245 [Aspergillus niger]|nr:hypothetical protein CBS115989_3245 [Aspergillus niger]KAI2825788.1 hypothetical protein CBS133816_8144 [Aspergillus niger]KAI2836838.1 hypothetical protein CBS11350_9128 [Aspergillus niger]KAI2852414.1 hypothetical protein CBS11232_5707 [Aspergillus niger]KAI2854296.1 hypothetical protein CBS12448_7779 [Aspergillus niger]
MDMKRPQLSYFKAHGPPFPRKRISTCQILRGFARRHFAKHLKPFMNAETRPVDLPSEFKKLHFTVRTDVMVQETKITYRLFWLSTGAMYDSSDVLQSASVLIWADRCTCQCS